MCYKRIISSVAALALSIILVSTGCTRSAAVDKQTSTTTGSLSVPEIAESDMFTDRDKEIGITDTAVSVALRDNGSTCASGQVRISGNTVTITGEGTYQFTGTLTNGQIVVDAAKTDKVQLVFQDVAVCCATSAALYVKQADKVFVTLAADSVNTLSNQQEFVAIDDNHIDGVIFSKDDITFNGTGTLKIEAAYGHGVVSKDDLVITGGCYQINAADHALSGKDSVRIADGQFSLTAGKDGIHAANADDSEQGFVYIAGGDMTMTCEGDGIDADTVLQVKAGTLSITAGGGSANAAVKQKEMFGPGGWKGASTNTTETETTSAKGLKAGGNMLIGGGTIVVDAADDALHSNADLAVTDGKLTLSTGDDGVHADGNVTICGGTLTISKSYEGIEGETLDISGGEISITASDDGLNAAGGNDESGFGGGMRPDTFSSNASAYIRISGGNLRINADGDGVDSNGNVYVSGGETYVSGPTDSGNGALDYDGEAIISGGVFVALGASGMAQNFGNGSTQGTMLVNLPSGSVSGQVTLTDSNGKTLVSYTPAKSYASVVVSCPEIEKGHTYTLTAGEQTVSVEMTDLLYGGTGGMGGGMGHGPGGGRGPGGMGW